MARLTVAASVVAITAARINADWLLPGAALAALALLAEREEADRFMVFMALLPWTFFVATVPPWSALVGAVVVAVYGAILLDHVPPAAADGKAWIGAAIGFVAAALLGWLARQRGLIDGLGDALALVAVLVTIRLAAGATWQRNVPLALVAVMPLGPWSLALVAMETALAWPVTSYLRISRQWAWSGVGALVAVI
ncbi:MAG: hypothetical protein ACPHID_07865 [Thermoplasmatota archaeon]